MRNLDKIIDSLPASRRAKVTVRTRKLVAEETALRHLRQARELTQQSMANLLNIDQAGISKIENRTDMLLSTLRSYVEAMGGALRLVAEFPDGVAELSSLGEALNTGAPAHNSKSKAKGRSRRRKPRLVHTSD